MTARTRIAGGVGGAARHGLVARTALGKLFVVALTAAGCSSVDTPAASVSPSGDAGAGSQAQSTTGGSGGAFSGAGTGATSGGGAAAAGGTASGGGGSASGGDSTSGSAGSTSDGGQGTAGTGGSAGSSGAPGMDDRCDVGVGAPNRAPQPLTLAGNLGTHDPVVMAADGKFFLFSTGTNIATKTSNDLLSWQAGPDVLSGATRPTWLSEQVPGVSNLWAPDISYFGDAYHLYFSASTFGKNRSCIGHLSRPSLTSGSWVDHGPVVCSNVSTKDDWNAIDPNVIVARDGTPWLAFGSFWSGIKLVPLDAQGARVGTSLTALAARPSAGGALEAPFLVRRCGYYYLFVSWDKCCDGVNSTYNIRVGRASEVTGPYLDRDGKALLQGGGTLVLAGSGRWHGPGHNAVLFRDKAAYNVYHAYDGDHGGASTLRIAELVWDDDGWPISGGP
jgi:arabinan endo-1,5-alpha-L-arabinosidase